MGTKTSTTKKANFSAEYGNNSIFHDTLSLDTGDINGADIAKLCKIPAGTDVHRVVIKSTDMDTNGTPTLTAKIGFSPVDGSAAPSGADTAVAATAAFGQSAATTTYEIFPPYRVEKDSYLTLVIDTGAATAAAGTVSAKVEGEIVGVK